MRLGAEVQVRGSELVLVDTDGYQQRVQPVLRRGHQQVRVAILLGQHPHRWCRWSCPCLGQPVRRIDDPRREVLGRGCGVDARQGGQHLQLVAGQAPAGSPLRDVGGDSSVHIGLGRVTETELDPRAQQVLQRGPDLSPPGTRDHQVHAVGQPLRAQVHHRLLKSLELGLERQPAVEHQKDIPERVLTGVRDLAATLAGTKLGHRVDAEVTKQLLATTHGR